MAGHPRDFADADFSPAEAPADAVRGAPRTALLVLGMHRSGTSAVTGTLVRLGAIPPSHLIGANTDNLHGHWESLPFNELHARLLASAGTQWDSWTPFNPHWAASPAAEQFRYDFHVLLQQEFGDAPLFVEKDPRICKFVSFWVDNLRREGITPAAVIPVRHPLEVARSLATRDRIGTHRSLLVWLRHVLDAEAASRDVRRSFVRYEDLLHDWQPVVQKIAADLGVDWPQCPSEAATGINEFLSKDLRHHAGGLDDLVCPSPLAEWVSETFTALDLLVNAGATDVERATRVLDDVRSDFDRLANLFGPVVEEEQQQLRRDTHEQIRQAEQTFRGDVDYYRAHNEHLHRELEAKGQNEQRLAQALDEERREAAVIQRHFDAERRQVVVLAEQANAERRQTAALSAHLETERQLVAVLQGQIDAERRQTTALSTQLETERQSVAVLREQVEAERTELHRIRAEASGLRHHLAAATDSMTATSRRVEELLASGSWRVTAPLRTALRLLTGRRH